MTIERIDNNAETSGSQTTTSQRNRSPGLPTPQTAADFSFPMKPYAIQLDFMKRLFETIENGQFAIFESPTGTGKSLSIICGALTWLMRNTERPNASTGSKDIAGEPDWVVAFEKKRAAEEDASLGGANAEAKYNQWVAKTRRSEAMERKAGRAGKRLGGSGVPAAAGSALASKRKIDAVGTSAGNGDSDSDEFLVDAYYSDTEAAKYSKAGDADGPVQYSEEVRRLLERRATDKPFYDSDDSDAEDGLGLKSNEPPEEPAVTKVFYASRTHSQLQQFVREVKRTSFASRDKIRCMTLGSRMQLCTNDGVRQGTGSVYSLNEKCTEMQQNSKKKRCPFLPARRTPMFDFKDSVARKIMDIEELAGEGKRLSVCAYYGTRASVSSAHVVVLPYNMLLSKSARESMGISLKGNIVIVDEAHNLVDTVLAIHSVSLNWKTAQALLDMMQMYFTKYWRRLKGSNAVYIRQAIALLKALDRFMKQCDSQTAVMSVNEFLQRAHADHINVYKIDRYLRVSKLGRKLNMFAEARSKGNAEPAKRAAVQKDGQGLSVLSPRIHPATAVSTLESFMECIGNPNRSGARLVVTSSGTGNNKDVELKYLLLDPSESFGEICKDARAVILAGGTMKPANDAVEQLLPKQSSARLEQPQCSMLDPANAQMFAWNHVVAPSHICAQVIDKGPAGVSLKFALQDQSDVAKIRDAGNALAALCNVVPGGVVVFFPSYSLLRKMHSEWLAAGIIGRISKRKPVFAEAINQSSQPQKQDVLAEYTAQVTKSGSTGAVLLSVVGGKLSEGINFSDDLGRAVVMAGVPYPSLGSPELVERLEYYESGGSCLAAKGSGGGFKMGARGRELYESMCMRAVNQSIGRAIRHRGDYAAIVFLDSRYAEPRIASKLPAWITSGSQSVESKPFGPALARIASFFKRDFTGSG